MIVEFSVANFRSIKTMQTLSFKATGLKSAPKYATVDINNVTIEGEERLFKTLGVYGSNASGKSNIIKALDHFLIIIAAEASSKSPLGALCQPFLYQQDEVFTESFFQLVFIIEDVKYRYGITVRRTSSEERGENELGVHVITNEWLYATKVKNMGPLFLRKGKKLEKNHLVNKHLIPDNIPYDHSLFLTHAAAFDEAGECKAIRDYFQKLFHSNANVDNDSFRWISIFFLKNGYEPKKNFLKLLAVFNLHYDDITVEDIDKHEGMDSFPKEKIFFTKKMDPGFGDEIRLNLSLHESAGSQKLFDLVGLLIFAFEFKQSLLIIDEIDSNFHPALLIKLISLFNSPANIKNSQLVFTSHDTNLMSPAIMRRDQFYLAEKSDDHSSRLYSLADLKGIKNDADFAKQYLAGYYGALPVLGNLSATTNEHD